MLSSERPRAHYRRAQCAARKLVGTEVHTLRETASVDTTTSTLKLDLSIVATCHGETQKNSDK